jgi:hypothetical protein
MSDETKPTICQPAGDGSPGGEAMPGEGQPTRAAETADLEASQPSGPDVDQAPSSPDAEPVPSWSKTHVYIPGKGVRFRHGHRAFGRRGPTRRERRRFRYAALEKLCADMGQAIQRGEKGVSAVDFTRSLHLLMLMEREGQ